MAYGFNDDKSKNDFSEYAPIQHSHNASDINEGVLDTDRIPDLDASKVISGTFDVTQIPNLDTSKVTSGKLPIERGGTGSATAAEARKALGLSYSAGDLISGTYYGAGYVTGSGKYFAFEIPLNKVIDGNIAINTIIATVRQSGNYIYGNIPDGQQNVKSIAHVAKITGGIRITLEPPSAPPNVINNDSFGVLCTYSIEVS